MNNRVVNLDVKDQRNQSIAIVTQAILGTRCLLVHGLRRRLTPGGAFWLELVLK